MRVDGKLYACVRCIYAHQAVECDHQERSLIYIENEDELVSPVQEVESQIALRKPAGSLSGPETEPRSTYMVPKIEHLSPEGSDLLNEVIFCLKRLNVWLYNVAFEAIERGDTTFFSLRDMTMLSSRNPAMDRTYYGYVSQDLALRRFVNNMPPEQKWDTIVAMRRADYMGHFLAQCLENLRNARSKHGELAANRARTEAAVQHIYKVVIEFRVCVSKALEKGYIPPVESLRRKMTGLQEHFPELCRELGKPEVQLAWDGDEWWKPSPEALRANEQQARSRSRSPGMPSYQMPSNSTASDINGPQLNSSVFQGPVYFGHVDPTNAAPGSETSAAPQAADAPRSPGYQNTANFSGPNNRGTQIGQQFNFRDGPSPGG